MAAKQPRRQRDRRRAATDAGARARRLSAPTPPGVLYRDGDAPPLLGTLAQIEYAGLSRRALLAKLDAIIAAERARRLALFTSSELKVAGLHAAIDAALASWRPTAALDSTDRLRAFVQERDYALRAAQDNDAQTEEENAFREAVTASDGRRGLSARAANMAQQAKRRRGKREHMLNAVAEACDLLAGFKFGKAIPSEADSTPYRLAMQICPRPSSQAWKDLPKYDQGTIKDSFGSFSVVYRALTAVADDLRRVRQHPQTWRKHRRDDRADEQAELFLTRAGFVF